MMLRFRSGLEVLLLSLFVYSPSGAQGSPSGSFEALAASSDVVAIVEAIGIERTDDAFYGLRAVADPGSFVATETRLRVHAVFKGELPKEATLLHFAYADTVTAPVEGMRFIRFRVWPSSDVTLIERLEIEALGVQNPIDQIEKLTRGEGTVRDSGVQAEPEIQGARPENSAETARGTERDTALGPRIPEAARYSLAFLKLREDGRLEPATGQLAAIGSFRDLR